MTGYAEQGVYDHRGKALIMCSLGTEKDVAVLNNMAATCGFDVTYNDKTDSTVSDMKTMIEKVQKDEGNIEECCFLCMILCRGNEGLIYGSDGSIPLAKLVEPLLSHNCLGLAGKPKIFIIDGPYFDQKVVPDSGTVTQMLPSDSDFFYMISHLPRGKNDRGDEWKDSAFVKALTRSPENRLKNLAKLAQDLRKELLRPGIDGATGEQQEYIKDKAYPYTISTLRYPYTLCKPQSDSD